LPAGGDLPGRVYGRYQAGTGCSIAGTRCAVGPGVALGRHLLGTTRRAQGARSLGERRLVGQGRTPVRLRRALSGGHSAGHYQTATLRSQDRVSCQGRTGRGGRVGPTAIMRSQDRVSRQGRTGRQGRHRGGPLDGTRHPAPRYLRQVVGTDLKGTGEPCRPATGLGLPWDPPRSLRPSQEAAHQQWQDSDSSTLATGPPEIEPKGR
jgi:hypothetical protein